MQELELSDMLVQLRKELKTAQENAKDEDLQFKLEDIEVEVQFAVREKTEGNIGIKFYVQAGGNKEKGTETLHRIKLKMTPEDRSNPSGDVHIASEQTARPK